MMSRAAPTPVVDERAVYAFFESGDVVAVDLGGKPLWHRDLTKEHGEFQNNHGLGSSPAQTADMVLLNIEHKGPSFLLAVDKQTGETRWKAERPSGSSWTTPIVVGDGTSQQIVVSSGGNLASYDVENGRQLWVLEGLKGNSVPSPCAVGDFIFTGARIPEFGSASEAAKSNLCVRVTGDDSQPYELCWRAAKAVSDYASPVVDGEQVYFLNKVGVLYCVDAMSGETIYQQRLRAECWATPIITDAGIYFFRERRHDAHCEARSRIRNSWRPINCGIRRTLRHRNTIGKPIAAGHGRGGAEHADGNKPDASDGKPGGV